MRHTIKRNEANVSWNPLRIQADWLCGIPIDLSRAGIAGKIAALLKASKDCAKQNTNRSTDLRVDESRFCGSSTSISAEDGRDDDIIRKVCKQRNYSQMIHLCEGQIITFS